MTGDRIGQTLGKWRLDAPIGSGGMGEVYLASRIDGEVRHPAAIKILHSRPGAAPWLEPAAMRAVRHHHVARLIETGVTADRRPYLVMEYVDGRPITEYADQRGLPVEERLSLFQDVCAAVSAIHQSQWVHLDLKPGNILVNREGMVKVIDFGVSRPVGFNLGGEPVQAFSGPYASPELVQGEAPGRGADLYALGAVLYELLSGHPPFDPHLADAELHKRIVCQAPEPPSLAAGRPKLVHLAGGGFGELDPERIASMRGGLRSAELRRALGRDPDLICLFALRKEPGRRYDDAEDMAKDLESVLNGRRPQFARSGDPFYSGLRAARRRPLAVAGIMMAVSGTFAGWALPRLFQAAETSSMEIRQAADRAADATIDELRRQLGPALAAQPRMKESGLLLDAVVKAGRPADRVKTQWEDLADQSHALIQGLRDLRDPRPEAQGKR